MSDGELTHDEVRSAVLGKRIASVKLSSYMGWPCVVEEILLEDGTVIDLAGNTDVAYVCGIDLPAQGQDVKCQACGKPVSGCGPFWACDCGYRRDPSQELLFLRTG